MKTPQRKGKTRTNTLIENSLFKAQLYRATTYKTFTSLDSMQHMQTSCFPNYLGRPLKLLYIDSSMLKSLAL